MLENLIAEFKNLKFIIDAKNEKLANIRLEIISIMEEMNEEKVEYSTGEARLSHPKSFDPKACKEGNPKEYNEHTHIETIEVFDDKTFGLVYPNLINKYMKAQTPRLTIK